MSQPHSTHAFFDDCGYVDVKLLGYRIVLSDGRGNLEEYWLQSFVFPNGTGIQRPTHQDGGYEPNLRAWEIIVDDMRQ